MKVSSICALSAPVWVHCAMKSFCERFAIVAVMKNVSGIVTRATSASSQDVMNIMTSTPMTVSSEVSSWLSVCCRLCATLSMSLVTRLSSSPRCMPSKYFSGSRLILSSTSARSAKTVSCTTRLSTRACSHMKTLESTYSASTSSSTRCSAPKSMPCPGLRSMPGQQVRALIVALGAQPVDDLLLGGTGGQELRDRRPRR